MALSVDEIVEEMRRNPKGVRFADACKVATHFFGEPRQNGTSHKVWKMPWPSDPRVNMQAGEGGKAKPYQVRQVLAAVDLLLKQQQTTEPKAVVAAPAPRKQKRRK
ncbi:MAG: toxin HicA [Deltaproteobacteria bacterium]|nr:toxin HicA [Deltaproteobacteria bacterium]